MSDSNVGNVSSENERSSSEAIAQSERSRSEAIAQSEQVRIFDTTLRDGEQAPGIALTKAEKVEIAEQLARLQVDILEAGFPVSSPGEFDAVAEIASTVKGPVIAALARTATGDIERAAEALKGADRWRIHTFISTSDVQRESMLKMSYQQVLDAIRENVTLAKSYTDDVEFSAQDATRTPLEFLLECYRLAVMCGATTINVPDTVGYATPTEFGELIRIVRDETPDHVVISTHCHNDLGLAVANSLAGIEHGAGQVEVAVNGIGERAGNCSLEEIAMVVRTRGLALGKQHALNIKEIVRTSRLVAMTTGYNVQPNKAVVGSSASDGCCGACRARGESPRRLRPSAKAWFAGRRGDPRPGARSRGRSRSTRASRSDLRPRRLP